MVHYVELVPSASKTTHVIMRFRSRILDNLPFLGFVHLGLCRRHSSNSGCGCPSGSDSSSGTDHRVGCVENGWASKGEARPRRTQARALLCCLVRNSWRPGSHVSWLCVFIHVTEFTGGYAATVQRTEAIHYGSRTGRAEARRDRCHRRC